MHKMVILYPEPTDREQFRDHYVNRHLPMVDGLPGLLGWRYSLDVAGAADASPYFAIFEADFADEQAMVAAQRSPQGQAAMADMANYATGGAVVIHYPVEGGSDSDV